MKVTTKNYKEVVSEKDQHLLLALIRDLCDVNKYTDDDLYIDWQDYHNEYSPERVDPCPDYYGYYTLRFEKQPYETIGSEMTIEELDNVLCILFTYNYLQNVNKKINKNIVV